MRLFCFFTNTVTCFFIWKIDDQKKIERNEVHIFCSFLKRLSFRKHRKKNFFICREGKGKKFCNIVSCYNFLLLFIELTSQLHPSCLCLAGLATVFENQRKSLIHHCEHSELSLLKVTLKCQKLVDFGEFLKTVLPDRSVLIRQNLWKMPK